MIILLSGKYHMGSIVAIFLALGIGIFIGGSLGQQWMFQTEQHTLSILMEKYEDQLEENKILHKDNNALQLMHRTVVPLLEHKRILWIRPHSYQNDMLAEIMVSAGAEWIEAEAGAWLGRDSIEEDVAVHGATSPSDTMEQHTDMIIISDPEQIEMIMQLQGRLKKEQLDAHTEQASSASKDIDHHTSVE